MRAFALNESALEMQGDHKAGVALFDVEPEIWATKNPFIGHVWWHAALFEWNAGQALADVVPDLATLCQCPCCLGTL